MRASQITTAILKLRPWENIVLAIVLLSVATPVCFLILGSLSKSELPIDFSLDDLGLQNYVEVWSDPQSYEIFANTFIYVIGSLAIGCPLAFLFAWLIERTDLPYKSAIYACVTVTLAVPGMLQAMAWVVLLSPRIGFLNKLLGNFGIEPINIYSLGGMIFVEGLRLVPTAFIMLVPLIRSIDPTLEEAAKMAGAPPRSVMWRVTLKLIAPGLVGVTIFQAMTALEVFEVPGILGLPADIHVFSTKIYSVINSQSVIPPYNKANALSMAYVLIAVLAMVLYARVVRHSERYAVISGKGYKTKLVDLGYWRIAAMALVFVYILLTVILPVLVLVYVSLLPYLQIPSSRAVSAFTLKAYRSLFNEQLMGTILANTAWLVFITSTLTVVASFFISLIVVRGKFWGRHLLDQLAYIPQAIPSIVLGIAFIWVMLKFDQVAGTALYGGLLPISIAMTITFLPYGTRSMNAVPLQIHKELEEAAYTSGARAWNVWLRIFAPLLMPILIGVWIWVALHAVRLPTLPLMLYSGPENQVLSVMIWNYWDAGYMAEVGAIGTIMIAVLLLITVALREWGFGRRDTSR